MNSLTRRSLRPKLLASMTAALLALSACTINIGTGPGAAEVPVATDSSAFSAGDVMFASMMIPHHEGALAMVQMIENSSNDEAASLAQEIITAQKAEIEEMTLLLGSLSGA